MKYYIYLTQELSVIISEYDHPEAKLIHVLPDLSPTEKQLISLHDILTKMVSATYNICVEVAKQQVKEAYADAFETARLSFPTPNNNKDN